MPKRGKLGPALAISFLCHGLLLWPGLAFVRGSDIAQPLDVTLRAVVAAAQSAGERALLNQARPQAPKPAPLPTREATPVSRIEPDSARQDNTRTSTAEMPLRSEAAATGAGGAVAEGVRGGASRPVDGIDADGVRQYRIALATEARRFRRYPPRALAEEIGGTVEIRVAVAVGGQTQEIALARSSGHEMLDAAALDMMRRAAPRAPVPEPLRQRAFVIDLPVVFNVAER